MASVDCSELPNPQTPFAFLPPDVADEFQVSSYITGATLGALIWDILSNVPSDYKLLFKHRINAPTIAYFVSRLAALAYAVTCLAFQTASVKDCQALLIVTGVCFAVAVPASSLLFFFRVRAIFNDNKIIIAIFTFLWFSVLAGCITVPFAIDAVHIGPTLRCINSGVKPFSSAGIIISTVNDTLVLIAISLRMLYNASIEDNLGARVKAFWNGGALPALSRSILQSGQQYYLITVGGNILTMVMILSPSVKPIYHALFTIPNVAIENAMACKVYRDIKFGLIEPSGTTTIQRSVRHGASGSDFTLRCAPRPAPSNVDTIDLQVTGPAPLRTGVDYISGKHPPVELDFVVGSRLSSTYESGADRKKFRDYEV